MDSIAYGPGPDQVLDLHLPSGDGRVPVVVLLHGGFWRDGYVRDLTDPLARDLTQRGYAAVNLEYGRVGGTGGWPRTFADVASGLDSLAGVGEGRLDLDRVAVVGHSAGGLLASWSGVRPSLPAGAAGADPAVVPAAVADPTRLLPLACPWLGLHARDDESIPLEMTTRFAALVRDAGGEATVELVAGDHMSVIDPSGAAWSVVLGWLERRLS